MEKYEICSVLYQNNQQKNTKMLDSNFTQFFMNSQHRPQSYIDPQLLSAWSSQQETEH